MGKELLLAVIIVGTVWLLDYIHDLFGKPLTVWWTSTKLHRRLVKLLTRKLDK